MATRDEESFDGFGEGGRDDSNNSDIDLDGLKAEEEHAGPQVPEVPQPGDDTDDEEEEARWTPHLTDFQVPPSLNFIGDDLWDIIVEESNRYAQQKLGDRFANFHRITHVELKAFIGINIIMGIMRLPNCFILVNG